MAAIECHLPTYNELTVEQINFINSNSYIVHHKKDEVIFKQNMPVSHLVYLKSGLAKIFKECTGNRTHILRLSSSGNYIGLLSVFNKNQFQYSACSLGECDIVFTDVNVIKSIIKENGGYALNLIGQLCDQGLFIFDKLINSTLKQLPGRIADTILFFSQEIYKSDTFEMPLSRQELADLISTTKESVSRTLSEFKNDRLIELDDKKISIISRELIEVLSKIG
jgi:CRP/FNR family transcriptional regulator, polysaccharide utilization system transcription regulator